VLLHDAGDLLTICHPIVNAVRIDRKDWARLAGIETSRTVGPEGTRDTGPKGLFLDDLKEGKGSPGLAGSPWLSGRTLVGAEKKMVAISAHGSPFMLS
jgi:hypothetical protein